MENHPIPQDVTGFKFKLIGSVTVKQFLYLLGFGILTTVAFILPVNILLKIPMMVVFALLGISLAFVPIEGRPMDVMLFNFAKAIPSENRYIYRKRGANLASFQIFYATPQKQAAPSPLGAKVASAQDEKKAILLSRLRNSPFRPDEGELQHLANVRSFFEDKQDPIIAPPTKTVREEPAPSAKEAPPSEKPVAASSSLTAGFPTLPDVPNIVLGIIRDPRGKTLPNILVEVVDSNGIPVRTFKTNALGQFASATPLQNGTYKVYFEDSGKNHEFELKEITMNGEIFNPLEITSVDAREKLRRELFGGGQITTV
ncbi:MAG: hypothetical protein A2868_00265 [Candidatus Levybacteria bacterium RIFCSPHIGHO2_01_FULL_40_15b]|nr:MAG: hypothetical protein A2868_00265 [Candidatus Levybacteria bacterium RIFCSPHIGHO2_01_FULL_40_15b]